MAVGWGAAVVSVKPTPLLPGVPAVWAIAAVPIIQVPVAIAADSRAIRPALESLAWVPP